MLFRSDVPVYLGDGELILEVVTLKIRYKIDDDVPNLYLMIGFGKVMNILSRKYGIKMRNIVLKYETNNITFESNCSTYDITPVVKCFRFCDKSWSRDYLLKRVLEKW